MKGNKGEWSELYVLLHILMNKSLNIYNTQQQYDILKIYKDIQNNLYYDLTSHNILYNGKKLNVTPANLKNAIQTLLSVINLTKAPSFPVPAISAILNNLYITKIKQGNSYQKSDIDLEIKTNIAPLIFGMSIKSDLGAKSTLLNASKATNFIYRINGFTGDMNAINLMKGKSKIKDRVTEIKKKSSSIDFVDMHSQTFKQNLLNIDTSLPSLLAEILLDYYSNTGTNLISQYSKSKNKVVLEKLLLASALYMFPTKPYNHYLQNMGMIRVDSTADVFCYDITNTQALSDYLFNNTKLDTGSSSRHEFATIYKENNEYYIKLNLQIRFI